MSKRGLLRGLLLASTAGLVGAGCGSQIKGSSPSITSIDVTEACDRQVTTTITITGSGFQPLVVGSLNGGAQHVVNPTVTLIPSGGGSGSDGGGAGTGGPTLAADVVFVDPTTIRFDVTPALGLAAGSYDIEVQNPDGTSVTDSAALTIDDPPTVTSVVPVIECSAVDEQIVVNGTGFNSGVAVTIGGVSIPSTDVTMTSSTALMVSLPAGTVPPTLSPVDVKVTNTDRCEGTLPGAFTETPPPTVTAVQPDLVCATQGETVTITGTNFRDTPTVTIGTTALAGSDVQFVSSTDLIVTIPAGTLAAGGPYDVTVTNPEGSPNHCSATDPAALTVVPPPTIASVAPSATCPFPIMPATMTITGTGFRAGASVTIGSFLVPAADVTVSTDGMTITVNVPPGLPVGGPYDVTVVNQEGCSATATAAYKVDRPPTVNGVSATEVCSASPSPSAIISGNHFQSGATVTIDGIPVPPASVTFVSSTALQVIFPAGLPVGGPYSVTVTNPDECQATGDNAVTVAPPPTLLYASSSTIAECGAGTGASVPLTLYGEHLESGASVTLSPVGSCPGATTTTLATTWVSAGAVTLSIPGTIVSCDYAVLLTDPDLCSTSLPTNISITIGAPITVATVTPNTGYNAAPEPIVITGTGFSGSATVTLSGGGLASPVALTSILVVDPTDITATVPAGIPAGTYDVTVQSPAAGGCTATLTAGYTATATPSFVLNKVIPPFGCTSEDTNVDINAAGGMESTPRVFLRDTTTGALLQVKHVAFVDATDITADVRGSVDGTALAQVPAGKYDIIVVNPDGTGSTLPYAFDTGYTETTACPPEIASVNPNEGQAGETGIVVTGANFDPAATVDFVDSTGTTTPATVTGTTTSSSLTFTVPAGVATGAYEVKVTNPDGEYGVYAAFVVAPPSNKLTSWSTESSTLETGRRALASVVGHDDLGNKFLYAIGGLDASGNPLPSVEAAPISIFGGLGKFFQTSPLGAPRAGLVVASGGATGGPTYLYAMGGLTGTSATATATASIEEARVLTVAEAPAMPADPTTSAGGTLATGTWYYEVSAVFPTGTIGTACPSYESLPSDEGVVTTDIAHRTVTVAWTGTFPTGTTFNLYRSPKVGLASGSEVLLASGVTGTSFVDDGSATPGTATALPSGSLTTWCPLTNALSTPRIGPSIAIAPDPTSTTGGQIVYVLFGASAVSPTLSLVSPSYDMATLSADGSSLGTFAASTSIGTTAPGRTLAQAQFALDPTATPAAATVFLVGGMVAGGGGDNHVYKAPIQSDGSLGSFVAYGSNLPGGDAEDGAAMLIANDLFYVFGGQNGFTAVPTTANDLSSTVGPGPFSSTSIALPGPLATMGYASTAAFEYLVGGTSTGTNVTNVVYSTIF